MPDPMSDKHYEEDFEFPLWKLIKKRAKEKDISYVQACKEVVPEYVKTIRYRDTEFEDAAIQKRVKEKLAVFERERIAKKNQGE